ncbi:MAG TPA: cation:proton antiporter [Roseiflexaceae bacterium]|nr:cation:proton antiporter [Roseiflexaceae bacterium]
MHPHLPLLINITVALFAAFIGGYLARRLGLPALVGYLLAGLAIGPFTPGFVGDKDTISQLAEMGVIFLMFGVGLHFSLKDLWTVRRIAIPGAVLQMLIATGLGFALTRLWGWTPSAGLVLGLAISIASTVVLLRGLVDNGLLNTPHGQVAVGWLVLEDLATIAILVLLPAVLGTAENPVQSAGLALLQTALFVGLMLLVGARLMPWLLTQIAHTRSRELFILAVVALALGTALGAAELFGVSLALGAFLAGVVIGESDVSHQVGAEVLPFREIFAVLFFVSVGMLVDPATLWANAGQVLALTALIVGGKALTTLLMGAVLPASGRTMLVVAAGLSQIGEFSFIVGQAGVALDVLSQEQYGLILAAAVLSIVLNPLLFRALPGTEQALQRVPSLWRLLERSGPTPAPVSHGLEGHVVIVGYGRVGEHIVAVLDRLGVPRLVVEQDAARAAEFQQRGIPTLFGDAANSEVLTHAGLERARAVVVTIPDETAAELVVTAVRDIAPALPVIARAATNGGVQRLHDHGAQDVIHPELEGGLEVVRHTLLALGYPPLQVQQYTDAVRHDAYDVAISSHTEHLMLDQLIRTVRGMEIAWHEVTPASPLVGQTLAQADLRARSGASVIALVRAGELMAIPKSSVAFAAGDLVGLIGAADQIQAAAEIIGSPSQAVAGTTLPATATGAVVAP